MADAQDTKTLRGFDEGRLGDELVKLKKEQFNLRFQQATGQLEKSSRIREVRRAIARVRTVLREKAPKATV
jgi:large subunit ribosomal protein L29